MIQVAICDDERPVSEFILKSTELLFKDSHLLYDIKMYTDSKELFYDIYDGVRFDIALLDIEMPNYDGMHIARLLKEKQPECLIIFLTAHPQYAIDAFELEIFRYIPKNELETRFEKYLNEAVSQISKLDEQSYIIEKKGYIEKIPYKNIRYLKKDGKYTALCCTDNHEARVRKPINIVFDELNSSKFVTIDRGCIVNVYYISKMFNNDVYLKNGERLPVSRSNLKNVKDFLAQYWGGIY